MFRAILGPEPPVAAGTDPCARGRGHARQPGPRLRAASRRAAAPLSIVAREFLPPPASPATAGALPLARSGDRVCRPMQRSPVPRARSCRPPAGRAPRVASVSGSSIAQASVAIQALAAPTIRLITSTPPTAPIVELAAHRARAQNIAVLFSAASRFNPLSARPTRSLVSRGQSFGPAPSTRGVGGVNGSGALGALSHRCPRHPGRGRIFVIAETVRSRARSRPRPFSRTTISLTRARDRLPWASSTTSSCAMRSPAATYIRHRLWRHRLLPCCRRTSPATLAHVGFPGATCAVRSASSPSSS